MTDDEFASKISKKISNGNLRKRGASSHTPRTQNQKEYIEFSPNAILMAKMSTCPCGFTVISPKGEEEVKKHMVMHLSDTHPGSSVTEEELGKTIKSV